MQQDSAIAQVQDDPLRIEKHFISLSVLIQAQPVMGHSPFNLAYNDQQVAYKTYHECTRATIHAAASANLVLNISL